MDQPELNHRARAILRAVVREYLAQGSAVGSRTITRKHNIDLSPATVRNVMADLEEVGLLEQPHQSSGRIPTQVGLRFFIDSLVKVRNLSPREQSDIRATLPMGANADVLAEGVSQVLSQLTQHAGVVVASPPDWQRIDHIEFHPLRDNRYLCVLVTTDGRVQNRLFDLEADIDRGTLDRIHNYLDEQLTGLTLGETRRRVEAELASARANYDDLQRVALELSHKALESEETSTIAVSGRSNLIETGDEETIAQTKELLRALETKEVLLDLLEKTSTADGVQVFLGAETELDAMKRASVIARPFGPNEQAVGAIAVIGPMRMNYSKIMSVVDFTATILGELLEDPESR